MALIIEDGSVVSGANSYVSVDNYAAWADARGFAYSSYPAIEQKILRAMDYIESLPFIGQKHIETQPLQWPRDYVYIDGYSVESDEIPKDVKTALYEAIKADIDGNSKMLTTERETVSEKIGDISVTYASNSSMQKQTPSLTKALRKLLHPMSSVSRA